RRLLHRLERPERALRVVEREGVDRGGGALGARRSAPRERALEGAARVEARPRVHEEPQLVLPEEAPLALDQRERLVEVSGPEALEPAAHPPRARDPVGIDESLLERRERRDLLAGRHRAGRAEATHGDATGERRDREQPGGGLHARTPGQYDARAL